MATTAERYNAAVALAKQGKYGEALKQIDGIQHPKVEALRQKITALMDADLDDLSTPATTPKAKKQPPAYRRYTKALLIVLLVILTGLGVAGFMEYQRSTHESTMYLSIYGVCLDVYDSSEWGECREAARSSIDIYRDEIEFCLRESQNGDLEQQFIDCLIENDVKI